MIRFQPGALRLESCQLPFALTVGVLIPPGCRCCILDPAPQVRLNDLLLKGVQLLLCRVRVPPRPALDVVIPCVRQLASSLFDMTGGSRGTRDNPGAPPGRRQTTRAHA